MKRLTWKRGRLRFEEVKKVGDPREPEKPEDPVPAPAPEPAEEEVEEVKGG